MLECRCCQFSCHVISVDAFHPVYSYLLHHLINVITVRDNQLSGILDNYLHTRITSRMVFSGQKTRSPGYWLLCTDARLSLLSS